MSISGSKNNSATPVDSNRNSRRTRRLGMGWAGKSCGGRRMANDASVSGSNKGMKRWISSFCSGVGTCDLPRIMICPPSVCRWMNHDDVIPSRVNSPKSGSVSLVNVGIATESSLNTRWTRPRRLIETVVAYWLGRTFSVLRTANGGRRIQSGR